jgi:hypothetical protein
MSLGKWPEPDPAGREMRPFERDVLAGVNPLKNFERLIQECVSGIEVDP